MRISLLGVAGRDIVASRRAGQRQRKDGVVAFAQTDFTEDVKEITIPVPVQISADILAFVRS